MSESILKTPPLIEAIMEIKWELTASTPAGKYDPHYQFLLGTFHNNIKTQYPYHEQLPTSQVPDDMTGAIVKHRFRVSKDAWPLVQIGPGIITINETERYGTFETFKPKVLEVVKVLFESHPNKTDLKIKTLRLRYIDAVEFDYSSNNVHEFLTQKMHIPVDTPQVLLINDNIEKMPVGHSLKTSFRCSAPPGEATFSLDTGHKREKRAIIWNQIFQSKNSDVPVMPQEFESWISKAHEIIYAWFEGVIEGELKEGFNNA